MLNVGLPFFSLRYRLTSKITIDQEFVCFIFARNNLQEIIFTPSHSSGHHNKVHSGSHASHADSFIHPFIQFFM